MPVVTPTVGRKVWFRPAGFEVIGHNAMIVLREPNSEELQPLDATVVAVHNDRLVNLVVLDAEGNPFPRIEVPLRQDGDDAFATDSNGYPDASYAEWMPYQKAQAEKAASVSTTGEQTQTA